MTNYNDIEIQTAKNLLKEGYKWIVRYKSGKLFAHCEKPIKVDNIWGSFGDSVCVCKFVPIFQSIHFGDKEPVSLESIVYPQVLDNAEKKYLSAVIRPFRNDVLFIMKYEECFSSRDYIAIWYRDKINGEVNYCTLPKFEKDTMYKNMEVSKHYTLEELGL